MGKKSKNFIEFPQQNKSSAYIFHLFYPLQTQVEAEILRRGCWWRRHSKRKEDATAWCGWFWIKDKYFFCFDKVMLA